MLCNIDTEKNISLLPHTCFYTELAVSFAQRVSVISGSQEQRFLCLVFTSFLSSQWSLCLEPGFRFSWKFCSQGKREEAEEILG